MMNFLQIFWLSLGLFTANVNALEGESIIGGYETEHKNFPYHVRLIRRMDRKISERETSITIGDCGGAILDDYHVLTAAHCFIDYNNFPYSFEKGSYLVAAGVTNFKDPNRSKWVTSSVEKAYLPKLFRDSLAKGVKYSEGDIAVLKLKESLNLSKNCHLMPVGLPLDVTFVNQTAIVSGYGINHKKYEKKGNVNYLVEKSSDGQLRFAFATVLSNAECERKSSGRVTDRILCALIDGKIRDSKYFTEANKKEQPVGKCNGDSGGPLVYNGTVIGVVSRGPSNCRENIIPGTYTRVSKYRDFIEKVRSGTTDPEILQKSIPIVSWGSFPFNALD